MLARHTYFAYPVAAALALCSCAGTRFARAENSYTEPFVILRTISTVVGFDGCWAGTLYYAAQISRLPLPEPVSDQALWPTFSGSAVSLAVSTGGSIFDPAGSKPARRASGKNGAQMAFASGINDGPADESKKAAENNALFYSATNAPNASSENSIRDNDGQIRTKHSAAGSIAAPSAAGLFPVPTQ